MDARIVPVEYSVAVDRYISAAGLRPESARVYRISLTSWAWPLIGQRAPPGRKRWLAHPPVVPLALLDEDDTGVKLADAVAHRRQYAQARTVGRELSVLRSAVGWWQQRHWIRTDPTAQLRGQDTRPVPLPPLTSGQRAALSGCPAGLREKALWQLLQDSGVPADRVLGLDAGAVDISARRARLGRSGWLEFGGDTGNLLGWLLAGRRTGPVFLTDRRAAAGTPAADICQLTGRGRLSYRRAAEIFTQHTRPLDPAGRGWMLHQLRRPRTAAADD
jgi:hypothetical protein